MNKKKVVSPVRFKSVIWSVIVKCQKRWSIIQKLRSHEAEDMGLKCLRIGLKVQHNCTVPGM